MFKFLKDKIKKGIDKFTKKIDEEAKEETKEVEETPEELKEDLKDEVKEIREEAEELKEEIKKEPEKAEEAKEKIDELKEEKEEVEKELKEVEKAEPEIEEKKEEKKEEKPAIEKKKPEPPEEKPKPAEPIPEKVEEPRPELKKEGFFKKIFKKKEGPKPEPEHKPAPAEEKKEEPKPAEPETKKPSTFLGKIKHTITTKKISEKQFDDMFWELELALLENNVAVEVIEKIKLDLKASLVDQAIPRAKVSEIVIKTLKSTLKTILDVESFDVLKNINEKKPYVICFVGINGSGKTTTIAKFARLLQDNKLKPILAAADTFRAAAIHQLEEHGSRLKVKVIKHDYGSDPAAVAFDAVKYAKSKGLDAVLIDTAGRMHSNANLVDEMKKIIRVANPDLKIFVGESITGNDCVEQAKKFNEAIELDGIILSKADIDEKGGAALSVSYVTGKPILYIGTGQNYGDLEQFNSDRILKNLGL